MREIEFLHTHCAAKQFLPISNPNVHLIQIHLSLFHSNQGLWLKTECKTRSLGNCKRNNGTLNSFFIPSITALASYPCHFPHWENDQQEMKLPSQVLAEGTRAVTEEHLCSLESAQLFAKVEPGAGALSGWRLGTRQKGDVRGGCQQGMWQSRLRLSPLGKSSWRPFTKSPDGHIPIRVLAWIKGTLSGRVSRSSSLNHVLVYPAVMCTQRGCCSDETKQEDRFWKGI